MSPELWVADAAGEADAERHAARQAFHLMRQQGRIGGGTPMIELFSGARRVVDESKVQSAGVRRAAAQS